MASLILIPWPQTTWSLAGRMIGRSPVSLTECGREQALAWADAMDKDASLVLYASHEVASVETAKLIEKRAHVKRRELRGLSEVNVGLWDGLTADELKRRYPKIYKRWCDDPFSVCPPEGEEFAVALNRIQEALARVVGDRRDRSVAVVLGPFSYALARSIVERNPSVDLNDLSQLEPLRYPWLKEKAQEPATGAKTGKAVLAQAKNNING